MPRTFVGALGVALPLKLALRYLASAGEDKFMVQILARGVLGMTNAMTLIYFKNAVDWTSDSLKRASQQPAAWFWAFTLAQFHVIFYMSRTLPNFFALPLTNLALAFVLEASYSWALGYLAFAAILFRAEIALLLATLSLSLLLFRKVSPAQIVKAVAIGTLIGAFLSLAVDSYFWQTPLMIPEIKGFLFNVVQGKSSEWGVEPWSAYFTTHLPKILGSYSGIGSLILGVLVPIGFLHEPTGNRFNHVRILGLASLLYVAIYSLQPHKEWRFVIYIVPVLTLLAANAVVSISNIFARGGFLSKLFFQSLVVYVIGAMALVSVSKLFVSSFNYPGGVALAEFHKYVPFPTSAQSDPLVVHLDVPVCMSGATRFGQLYDIQKPYSPWVIYDKTEDSEELEEIADSFDYLITVLPPANVSGVYETPEGLEWSLLETVQSFGSVNRPAIASLLKAVKADPNVFYTSAIEGNLDFFTTWGLSLLNLKDHVYIYQRTKVYPWGEI